MTRAYLRKDPQLFQRKVVEDRYPIGAYAAFEAVLCLGEQQPSRGRFASERLVRLLLEEPADGVRTGLGRWVPFLIEHGDLVRDERGALYIDGWDEWQEGDVTVQERMKRLRSRHRDAGDRNDVTEATVTEPSEPSAVGGKRLAVGGRQRPTVAASARPTPNASSTREPDAVLELQALAEELTGQPYAALNPYAGLGAKAVSEQLLPHGFARTETAWREVARRHGSTPPTIRQLVLEADDLLNPITRSGSRSAADADDADVRAGIEKRLAAARAAKGAQA